MISVPDIWERVINLNTNSSDQKYIYPTYSINSVIYHSIGYHNQSVHLN